MSAPLTPRGVPRAGCASSAHEAPAAVAASSAAPASRALVVRIAGPPEFADDLRRPRWSPRAAARASAQAPVIAVRVSVLARRRGPAPAGRLAAMAQTVLIVDDHASFRAFARMLLERDGYVVVGEAVDGTGALAAVDALRPTIVVLDVQLPDRDGFEVAELVAAQDGAPAVVLVSTRTAA